MMSPLISIIMSIYNGEKYLSECIESILKQTYNNFELFLVDDGSIDNSSNIIDEYSKNDERIVVIHKDNSGVSASRNIALEKCNGDYICIVDQDDILNEDYIEYFYDLIIKTGSDIAFTPTVDKFYSKINVVEKSEKYDVIQGKKAAVNMLYHKIVIAPWNKMIKRNIIFDNNIRFNEKYYNGEGFAFSIGCFTSADKVVCGYRKVYHYRVGDPSTGASIFKEKYINSSLSAQVYIKESYLGNDKELLKSWRFSNWHTHCDALNVMVGTNAIKNHRDLYMKIKKVCKHSIRYIFSPVCFQQKIRVFLYMISPLMASKIINHFRIRKFTKID